MAFDAKLHARDFLGRNFERDIFGVVDQHAIAAIRQIERHIFVGLFAAGAAIAIPAINDLAVFDKGGKTLAQAVDVFAYAKRELFVHEVTLALDLGNAHSARSARRNRAPFRQKIDPPGRVAWNTHGKMPACQRRCLVVVGDVYLRRAVLLERERGLSRALSGKMGQLYAHHIRHGRGELDGQQRTRERITTMVDPARRVGNERVVTYLNVVGLGGVEGFDAFSHEPVAVGKLHKRVSLNPQLRFPAERDF